MPSEPVGESVPGDPEADVRLAVDGEKCIGSGMCEMLEEDTFLIDEDTNVAGVIGSAMLSQERAEIVIDRCPSSAISVVTDAAPCNG